MKGYQEHRQSPQDRTGWSGFAGGEWCAGWVDEHGTASDHATVLNHEGTFCVVTLWAGNNENMARRRMLREGGR